MWVMGRDWLLAVPGVFGYAAALAQIIACFLACLVGKFAGALQDKLQSATSVAHVALVHTKSPV